VKNGAVVGFEVLKGGAGYSSAPEVSVPGYEGVRGKVELRFSKALEKNGEVATISLGR
jgi:hypothetical protein